MTQARRPLSPHLQVYKPQITSVLSIFHRITGVILCSAAVGLALWPIFLLFSPEVYVSFEWLASSWVGGVFFVLWVAAFFYHLCAGLRHLVWDMGYGFSMDSVTRSGIATVVVSCALTAAYVLALWL